MMTLETRVFAGKFVLAGAGFAAMLAIASVGGDAKAAACMKIEVAAANGDAAPMTLLVPDANKATYAARGFVEEACPAGEVYTSERIEAACQKFERFAPESREAIRQTYGVSTTEICEQGRKAVAEGM